MWLWRCLGAGAFLLGGLGIVLPIMPTVIFWIIAALCFAKSDPAWRDWIYARPGVGAHVELFVEKGQMTRSGKSSAYLGMALASLILCVWLWGHWLAMAASGGLIVIGVLVVASRRKPKG